MRTEAQPHFFGAAFISLFLFPFSSALAVSVDFDYACLGIDGIPLSNGSALATQCCLNGQLIVNAPANCKAGFNSIASGAAAGASFSVNLAQQTLGTAQSLNGAQTNLSATPSADHGSDSLQTASTSALTASGSGSASDGTGKSGTGVGNTGSEEAGGYRGSGKSGSGNGAGGGMALGSVGSNSKKSEQSDLSGGKSSDSAGGYVASNGGGAGAEKSGMPNFGSLFGKDGAGAKGDSANSELKFGEESAQNKNGGEDSAGTATDPSDYFKRIDKTASLFKIVSKRYTQETGKNHVGR